MAKLDQLGANIERAVDGIDRYASAHLVGSLLLGSALALAALAGGVAAFIVVLVALVKLFA
jgi:hypothetical protein